ncbi:zinc-dependent metalloprotease [Vibrio gallicus]|uniref:zinc-dependent metalloprotease n=1 Tax=Vibrio gallicus TaxID=190897 RepID=UPI0021C30581|nr:zinc-dependent metalloprotease [Vibrio gallicus]
MKKSLLHCSLLLASVSLFGCGPGDESYDTVAKDPDMLKSADIEQTVKEADGSVHARRYLYLRTIRKAPRYFASMGSNTWFNDTKLVTLHRSENGIEVLQEDKGAIGAGQEYSPFDNPENLRPLLTINGDYVDYKCATDSYDKCTNQEQENTDADVKWDQKKYFVPDLRDITVKDTGYNDLDMNRCLTEAGAPRLVNRTETSENDKKVTWNGHEVDLKNGIINLEIAQDYTVSTSAGCEDFAPQSNLDDYSLTVTSFVSIVALDAPVTDGAKRTGTLVSKNYTPVPYAEQETTTFGFFTTTIDHLDTFYQANQDSAFRRYLNRWNPKKAKLNYYLSNNFYEPKNAPYLAAATQSIDLINAENEVFKTGVPKIELAPAGNRQSGDLRYAIIELADEPLANGLLGYAPTATNPLTGETISAVVNQYSGNAINSVPYYWEAIRRSFNHGKYSQQQIDTQVSHSVSYTPTDDKISEPDAENLVSPIADGSTSYAQRVHTAKVMAGENEKLPASELKNIVQHKTANSIYQDREDGEKVSLTKIAKQSREDLYNLGRNNMLSTQALEHTVFGNGDYRTLPTGVRELPGEAANKYRIDWSKDSYYSDANHKQLKHFGNLSVADQQDIKVKLSAAIFASTISHEMGHSLGLRHNFKGSMDAENFNFNTQEIAKLKHKLTAMGYPDINPRSNSSSRMEYSVDAYTTGYGPYDIAALRFGYARQMELSQGTLTNMVSGTTTLSDTPIVDGKYVSLKQRDTERRAEIADLIGQGEARGQYSRGVADATLIAQTKAYQFCTDENTFLGNTCNRFDAGFTASQVSHNIIEGYKDLYTYNNTRDGKDFFGINYLTYYTISRMNTFESLHSFIDDSQYLLATGESGLTVKNQNTVDKVIKECRTQDPLTGKYDAADIPSVISFYGDAKTGGIVCDLVKSADNGRQFLLGNALEPAGRMLHLVFVKQSGDIKLLDVPYGMVRDAYISDNDSLGLEAGEVILDSDSHPVILRKLAEYAASSMVPGSHLVAEDWTGSKPDGSTITGKVRLTGHPLNSLSGDTKDPNHPYVNDRDVLGVWPDKLLSVRTLLSRVTTQMQDSSTTASLADSAFAGEVLKMGICRQALGGAYGTDEKKATSECFQAVSNGIYLGGQYNTDPDALAAKTSITNAYDEQNVTFSPLADWADINIETIPTSGYPVAAYFDLPMAGKVSLLRAMLNQFVLGSITNNTGPNLKAVSKEYREFASVYSEDAVYAYQSPIVWDFDGDRSTIQAGQANLAKLLKHDPSAKSMVVHLPGSHNRFWVKENNRLALIVMNAYVNPIIANVTAKDQASKDEAETNTKRLAKILEMMPQTNRNAELENYSLLTNF